MYACLSSQLTYFKNDMSKLHKNFLYMLPLAMARSSDDNAIRHVFPVLRMMSCLPVMGCMARG